MKLQKNLRILQPKLQTYMKNKTKTEFLVNTGFSDEKRKIKNGSPAARNQDIITPEVLKHISEKYLNFLDSGSIPF